MLTLDSQLPRVLPDAPREFAFGGEVSEPKNVIYGLYCLCHPDEGIRYVGQTCRGIDMRFKQHVSIANLGKVKNHLYHWVRKHGSNNLSYRILETVEDDSLLNPLEIVWISNLKEMGYRLTNQNLGGGGQRGFKHRAESIHKMSETTRGMHVGSKNGNWGKPMSPEAKEKMRVKKLGVKWTPERRAAQTIIRGEDNNLSKLTEGEVRQIRNLYRTQEISMRKLGSLFGVGGTAVANIVHNKTWRHVT